MSTEDVYDRDARQALREMKRHYSDHPWQAPLVTPEEAMEQLKKDGEEIFGDSQPQQQKEQDNE